MKMKLFLFVGLLIGSLGLSVFSTSNTYATSAQPVVPGLSIFAADPPAAEEEGGFGGGSTGTFNSSCEVKGIGWIICPLVTEVSKVVDAAYGLVSALLTVAPLMTTGGSANIYTAWTIMRNFANVAFVIGFMLIIFSQLTSIGLSNYGIKKMLPRLIVAAILVNVSYWICAIAVDVSNILGASLNGLFDGLKNQIGDATTGSGLPTGVNATQIGDDPQMQGWAAISVAVLAGTAAALYIGLSALLPALVAAVAAILTVLAVLSVRQALIVLLIVVSPLAFVAYLLPNTESLFKKWLGLFKTLLLMYPIIAMLFGASALASAIILATPAEGNNSAYLVAMQIMGALIAIIPLALTPIIMKTAGSVLNRVGAFVNNPNKGPFDRMRKGAEGYRKNRQEYRRLKAMNGYRTLPGKGMFARRQAAREAVLNNRKTELNRANADYVSGRAESSESFRKRLAQGGGEGSEMRAEAAAINVRAELASKEIKAASAVIEHMNLDSNQVKALARGETIEKRMPDGSMRQLSGADAGMRSAAIMSGVSTGTVGDVEDIIKSSASMDAAQRKILSSSVASSGIANKATYLGGQTIDDIAQGRISTEDDLNMAAARAIEGGKFSADKLADNDKSSLQRLQKVIGQVRTDVSPEKIGQLQNQAHQVLNDDRIKGRVTDAQQPILESMQATPQEPPQAPPVRQTAAQQPDVLNIPHNSNPTTGRTSAPAGSGRATILTPPNQNNDRP